MNDLDHDDLGHKERLHPLFLLTGLGKVARNAWGLIAGGAFLAIQDRWGLALLVAGLVIGASLVSLLVRWLTFSYRLGAHELRIDQGLLSRSSRAIPFDRVTDVDIEQGPIHRLFGLARVRMETGAATKADADEGVLDTISLDRAEAIREFVRARKRGAAAPVAEPEAQAAEPPPLFAMDRKRVLILGLFNFSLAVLAALVGASQTLGDVVGFDPFDRDFWTGLLASSAPLRDYVLSHQAITIVAGSLLLMALGTVTGLVRTVLREHGFRLDRTDSGLRRRRGLLTLTDVTIPARRVQAAMLVTGPLRRRFGWFALKLQSLAMDDKQGDHVVAPLATFDEAATIQRSLARPIAPDEAAWQPLAPGYFRAFAFPMAAAVPVALLAAWLLTPAALVAAGGALVAIAIRYLEHRRARYALDGAHLFIDDGWWRQRRAIIPVARIQSIDLSENGWTRLFGFARLKLGIAGGTLLSAFQVEALARPDAEALRDRLLAA